MEVRLLGPVEVRSDGKTVRLGGSRMRTLLARLALEAGKVGKPLVPDSPTGTLYSASIFAAVDTPIGPAYLGYGHAKDGSSSFYFFLGRPY